MKTEIDKVLLAIDQERENVALLHYALLMAKAYSSELTLYNVCEDNKKEELIWSLDLLGEFKEENTPPEYQDVKVALMSEAGDVVERIKDFLDQEDVDLLITGNHHGLTTLEAYFTSVVMGLLNEIHTPLLVIPENAPFKKMKKLLYTFDLHLWELGIINHFAELAKMLEAELVCLHILEDDENFNEVQETYNIVQSIYAAHQRYHDVISLDLRVGDHNTIAYYCDEEAVDMMITYGGNSDWKIQTVESLPGQMLRKLNIPIFIWK